ncbi:nucleopolyhedrovirus P10 family protein [Streptomyces broussonetiae]|uniref:Nucleopolyhedrovirus P10 family protein n=1 Tax=Streptomyces broussonetiae TaxID=2686304 RepID=A0A6I6N4X3_9ACTN|nr:nucleopolyhedrovirus P10 family protein [Streptomyces broussonetiae]QHA03905.1 nucleopolyhedrovirus P10 family protein [Streptomyces broussonetiae]
MTAERWTRTVRQLAGLGRLLPLGGPRDGAWIAEGAAVAVLERAAADELPGVRLGALRLALADPDDVHEPVVPPPPGALPPGPLRVTADFAATAAEPLPAVAARLRRTLATAATRQLGLVVRAVDLRVIDVLDTAEPPRKVRPPQPAPAGEPTDPDEARAATAALSVPGVQALTASLGRGVRLEERTAGTTALPYRHARVEVATGADHRAVEVARGVRTAVREELEDRPTVAVLVTAVG